MMYLKCFVFFVLVLIFMEVPADEIDDKSKKNSFYALTFNPNYSPDILIDEFILCLPESSEAFKLELELTNKYGCTGTIKDKVLCGIHNRENFDSSDYDLIFKIYKLLPKCVKRLISNKKGLTGHAIVKDIYYTMGIMYNI